VAAHGPTAVGKALDKLARVETLDIALGPTEFKPQLRAAAAHPPSHIAACFHVQQREQQRAQVGQQRQLQQLRPYTVADMQQLLGALARHKPQRTLPTLHVYSEAVLARGGLPGQLTLPLDSDWRARYVEVRACLREL
jgi:hypothetical protein